MIKGKVKPLKNDILVHNMDTGEKVVNGIILLEDTDASNFSQDDVLNKRGIRPRWCQVYDVGSNVDYVKKGDWVLLDKGRWTRGISVADGDEKIYLQKADPDGILVVSETKPADL